MNATHSIRCALQMRKNHFFFLLVEEEWDGRMEGKDKRRSIEGRKKAE